MDPDPHYNASGSTSLIFISRNKYPMKYAKITQNLLLKSTYKLFHKQSEYVLPSLPPEARRVLRGVWPFFPEVEDILLNIK